MSLSVKDPEAHRLAQAISSVTGESMTRVVIESLRERYAKIEARKTKASAAELLEIARSIGPPGDGPYLDHGDFLYDENGLPK